MDMDKIDEATDSIKFRTLPEIKINSLGNRKRMDRFWLALKSICYDYADNTQMHGLFYFRKNESNGFQRYCKS